MSRTHDDRLHRSVNLRNNAMWVFFAAAVIDIILIWATFAGKHGKHPHYSTALIHAALIVSGVAFAAYLVIRSATDRMAYHADRAFLSRLFASSGFSRKEADRLAHIKIKRG